MKGASIIFPTLTVLIGICFASCDLPKDPEDSLRKAEEDKLRVGVVEHPPYVERSGEGWMGEEVDLIEGFAKANNLQIEYVSGNESDLIKELEEYHLHLVVGGFEEGTVWKSHVTPSHVYDAEHVFLLAPGENRLLYRIEQFLSDRMEER